jgi:hypothetical protein
MLVIRDTSVVPQDDWTYIVQPTNHPISTRNYAMLYPMIKQHCATNGIEPPSEQDVIKYLCETLIIPCYESEGRAPLINKFALGVPNPPRLGGCCG